MPATRHMASSGTQGAINKIGSQNFDLWSIKFCVSVRVFSPIKRVANFSPNLSPIKNNIDVEKNTAIMFVIKAILLPNNAIPRITMAVFNSGIKQNATNINNEINV